MKPDFAHLPAAHVHPYQSAFGWASLALAAPLLWAVLHTQRPVVLQANDFVFFHTAIEVFAVVVALLIFVTGYRAILSIRKNAVVLLGIMFLGVGLLDFLHLMSYVGMPDAISPNSAQKSIFFWLAARLLGAGALLLYVWLRDESEVSATRKRVGLAVMLLVVGVLAAIGLLWPQQVPTLFVPGVGLTPLKIGLEWLIIAIHVVTLGVLWQRRRALQRECVMALVLAAALSAVSELFFTMLGIHDQGVANAIGHVYKVVAYLYLFHATFNEALQRPLQRLEVQHLREKLILSAAPDGVLWVDSKGKILLANPAMETLSGYSPQELTGQNVDIFLPEHLRARHAVSMRNHFMAPHSRPMGLMDLHLVRRDGLMLPVDISLGHWEDEGTPFAIAYIRDLTERRQFEDSLKHQATHDELTGLPNRWLFRLQLDQALARAERSRLHVAVLFIDLDYFKSINDSFGHSTGDILLAQAGARMRSVLRGHDTLARQGGDEFAVLLPDLANPDDAIGVTDKLLAVLKEVYHLKNQDVYSSASVGVAFYPDDAPTSETLLRYADMAMYQAKANGRGAYAFYSQDMDRSAHDNMQLHTHLKEAMARNGLQLHYQPQVDVETGDIVGAEALLRWFDPVLGHIPPARFIPVAEATGLILPLSEWVLETACQQIAAWTQAGTPLRVAVNFSAQQFRQRDLPEQVRQALLRTGALAQWLDIEITESLAMSQPEQASEQLAALVAMGCRVALDDFGTGYSSLSYLKALPIHKLKIDKSFMDGIPEDASDVAISRAIIALAKSLGLKLIAEGVETDAQLAFLRQYGCDTYQGWLFAKAMDAAALTERLQALTEAGLNGSKGCAPKSTETVCNDRL
ncbi:EAL domain-containing protein [Rhodoferax sp.]|uniref:putative bifunctional diguanylate cyclase/phosphodiesterase n=1 Tax=Rhodoferax sp. TaxID=50421 RepID=UPI00283DBBCD|nr:EAL domain-containing protein [Rhodoferax sp.]MDR3367640.1 EAL domain-containing protein [Rhodoferax sp.]